MCFIDLNHLYTAHHNSLGICHQLKIRNFYETFNFSTQCICMGTGRLFVYGLRRFRGNAHPLRIKTVFAVVSINKLIIDYGLRIRYENINVLIYSYGKDIFM